MIKQPRQNRPHTIRHSAPKIDFINRVKNPPVGFERAAGLRRDVGAVFFCLGGAEV